MLLGTVGAEVFPLKGQEASVGKRGERADDKVLGFDLFAFGRGSIQLIGGSEGHAVGRGGFAGGRVKDVKLGESRVAAAILRQTALQGGRQPSVRQQRQPLKPAVGLPAGAHVVPDVRGKIHTRLRPRHTFLRRVETPHEIAVRVELPHRRHVFLGDEKMSVRPGGQTFRVDAHATVPALRRRRRGTVGEQAGEGAAVRVAQDDRALRRKGERRALAGEAEELQPRTVINEAVPGPAVAEHHHATGHHLDRRPDPADCFALGVPRIRRDTPHRDDARIVRGGCPRCERGGQTNERETSHGRRVWGAARGLSSPGL